MRMNFPDASAGKSPPSGNLTKFKGSVTAGRHLLKRISPFKVAGQKYCVGYIRESSFLRFLKKYLSL